MSEEEKRKLLFENIEKIRKAFEEQDEEYAKMADGCDHDLKIAVTQWVMKHIVDHARDGGTYRYLIYDRLGFGPEAYAPLCHDGMTINNEFDLSLKKTVADCLKRNDVEAAKRALGYCDEPGCYNEASCGYPAGEKGYRYSCGDHYRQYGKSDD